MRESGRAGPNGRGGRTRAKKGPAERPQARSRAAGGDGTPLAAKMWTEIRAAAAAQLDTPLGLRARYLGPLPPPGPSGRDPQALFDSLRHGPQIVERTPALPAAPGPLRPPPRSLKVWREEVLTKGVLGQGEPQAFLDSLPCSC
jgi:hypothetical protein